MHLLGSLVLVVVLIICLASQLHRVVEASSKELYSFGSHP